MLGGSGISLIDEVCDALMIEGGGLIEHFGARGMLFDLSLWPNDIVLSAFGSNALT